MQPDEIRAQQRDQWNRSSAGWDRWDHIVLPMIAEVGAEMVRSLDVRPERERRSLRDAPCPSLLHGRDASRH